ncbi:uncharacterized protein LOC120150699 [Hibiscus syriacus]|nr:uncharacterized protein LOC120150699 [Hibiscus syriacus]
MSQLPSALGLVENKRQESIVIKDDMSSLEHNEADKSEDGSPWQRIKWTAKSVKLLITILSYIGEDPSTDCTGSRMKMSSLLRKQGKWKCVSKVMADRGYHVSPQQCEDKFNNLNKTYRRLNDLLGRGTSCKVVENPKFLDIIDVSEEGKEDARKLLTSKHLFFEEMCSYHNANRMYLPHDQDLLQSLLFNLKNEDDHKLLGSCQTVLDGADENAGVLVEVDTAKDNGAISDSQPLHNATHQNLTCHEENEVDGQQNQLMAHRTYRLEKRKLQLKSKLLNLEKQSLKWKRRSWKQDLKLDKMRQRNKRLKLGNECITMLLTRKRTDLERA